MAGKEVRRHRLGDATPFGALALATAIASACGGKSIEVQDGDKAGESGDGQGGKSSKGGKGGKGNKGGSGGDAGNVTATGGSGGGGGSSPMTGGSAGRGVGGVGGASGVGGAAGALSGAFPGGFAGFAGDPGGRGPGGAPAAGFAGVAGFAGAPIAGFAGGGSCANCYDANPCTDDICLDLGTCLFRPNTLDCDDGNACTTADKCSGGTCVAGSMPSCDDSNVCTLDSCDPKLGCKHADSGQADDATERKIPDSETDCGPPSRTAVAVAEIVDAGNVVEVGTELDFEHTWGGDLTITLSHDGVTVTLLDRFPNGDGSLSSNFDGAYMFFDGGSQFEKLGNDATIPTGLYAPVGSLAMFNGHPSAGDWTLTVSDGCHGDEGKLHSFRMIVSSSCTPALSCTGMCNSGECICAQ